jgi:glycosyltransferase involved in cell wall biosynthesis
LLTVTRDRPTVTTRGTFVLFEGLLPTVIDSQVLTHVRLVRELLGIDMTVVAFACSASVHAQSVRSLAHARQTAGGDVRLLRGVRPALPGSALINRFLLGRALGGVGPVAFLHARGDYAAAVTGPLAQNLAVPMLWDCRGDSRAELYERIGAVSPVQRLPLELRAWMSLQDLKRAGGACAAACFVSEALRELMSDFCSGKPTWVLPCLADENDFFFDEGLRQRMRTELGFGKDDPVYLYSGSLASYQCFEQMVATFATTLRERPNAHLIVLTPYIDAARQKIAGVPADRVVCLAVANAKVNDYLNAADFGFLLRDDTPVNHVAFPTKFAEYALAGLSVIIKQSPPSCIAEAKMLGNDLALEEAGQAALPPPASRAKIAAAARARMGRRASIERFAEIYRSLAVLKTSGQTA